MNKADSKFEPTNYFDSMDDPAYFTQELQYCVDHVFSQRKQNKPRQASNGSDLKTAEDYLNRIIRGLRKIFGGSGNVTLPRDTEECVIEAVKQFGMEAVRPSIFEEGLARRKYAYRLFVIEDKLGAVVCTVIRHWREQVSEGDYSSRRNAIKRLKEVGKVLIPDARGKRKQTTDPQKIRSFYWTQMYRLYHIQHWLQDISNSESEVETIGKKFDMPADQIRKLFLQYYKGIDDYIPRLRNVSIKEIARQLTAKHFKIKRHTVSNILAS